ALQPGSTPGQGPPCTGGVASSGLGAAIFLLTWWLLGLVAPVGPLRFMVVTAGVFYCLAGTTLVREVRDVFRACENSLEAGRRQVGRIVGRDTESLTADEVRTAALETLAENLSDGVVAPLFWYMVAGLPGMMAYKMVNTLDSMIGYRTERYRMFGCVAARVDDVANWIPARLTALLMIVVSGSMKLFGFVGRYGHCHASPNSGYPEAALAGILGCRFGGTHDYFGQAVYKPYIGETARVLTFSDMEKGVKICRRAESLMVVIVSAIGLIGNPF
ncbi:MAG: adenosylcobinamide-phosphate synthase CbiB, partial [Muribaculaceae bacterium]|nr:adenosylcobinamide-phosphate synthase CbiB [Muribaculaceae bacterium]